MGMGITGTWPGLSLSPRPPHQMTPPHKGTTQTPYSLIKKGSFLIIGKEWVRGRQGASDNFEIRTVSGASSEPGRTDKANLQVQAGVRLPG